MYVRGCEYITYSHRGAGGEGVSSKILHFDCRLQGRKGGLEPVNGRKKRKDSKIEVDLPPFYIIFDTVLIRVTSLPPLEFLTKIMKFKALRPRFSIIPLLSEGQWYRQMDYFY